MKKMLHATILMLATTLGGNALANSAMVKLVPEDNVFVVGNTYEVHIVIEEFPKTEGGGVNLEFNSASLQIIAVQVDDGTWGFVNQNGSIDNQSGQITNIVFSDFNGISGNAPVATILIKAVRPGRSLLKLSPSTMNPFAGDGKPIQVTLMDSRVIVKRR